MDVEQRGEHEEGVRGSLSRNISGSKDGEIVRLEFRIDLETVPILGCSRKAL